MTRTYFINGKKVNLDSSEWNLIYSDGRWSNEGINLFFRKKDGCFILEKWTNWQTGRDHIQIMSKKEAIDYLLNNHSDIHPERVDEAFQKMGFNPETF